MARPRLVVATRSQHKLRELRQLLQLDGVDLVSLDELGIPGDPVEDRATFEANASIKARFAARASGLPSLADDSGLEVDAHNGGPGVRTRRFAGENATDADNNERLLRELPGLPPDRRGARYVCVLALALPDRAGPRGGLRLVLRRGTCRGGRPRRAGADRPTCRGCCRRTRRSRRARRGTRSTTTRSDRAGRASSRRTPCWRSGEQARTQ